MHVCELGLRQAIQQALTTETSVSWCFSHVHGLMDLCNATQQIYLELPSWHTDWQEKWEGRRKRLHAAPAQATP